MSARGTMGSSCCAGGVCDVRYLHQGMALWREVAEPSQGVGLGTWAVWDGGALFVGYDGGVAVEANIGPGGASRQGRCWRPLGTSLPSAAGRWWRGRDRPICGSPPRGPWLGRGGDHGSAARIGGRTRDTPGARSAWAGPVLGGAGAVVGQRYGRPRDVGDRGGGRRLIPIGEGGRR